MTTGIGILPITFTVKDIAHRAVPTSRAVFNEFDYFGTLLGLERLPEEKNKEYKSRLMDVFVNRANSLYTGLVNGITRELGLSKFRPLLIELSSSLPVDKCPSVEILDNKVIIYSDVYTQEIELEVLKSRPQDDGYLLLNLVSALNESAYFTFTITDSSFNYKRSDTLLSQTILKEVVNEQLTPGYTIHKLDNSNLDRRSIVFSETNTFRTEVTSSAAVLKAGQYHIDYQLGLVTTFSSPNQGSFIRYRFVQDTFRPSASAVIIRAINAELFQSIIFHQEENELGEFVSTVPTRLGANIINELLSVNAMYFGD